MFKLVHMLYHGRRKEVRGTKDTLAFEIGYLL